MYDMMGDASNNNFVELLCTVNTTLQCHPRFPETMEFRALRHEIEDMLLKLAIRAEQMSKDLSQLMKDKVMALQEIRALSRSKSVGNAINLSVMMFYRRTFDGKKTIVKHIVGNVFLTYYESPLIISDESICRPNRRPLPTDVFVGNYRRPSPSENPFVHPLLIPTDLSVGNYRRMFPSVITDG